MAVNTNAIRNVFFRKFKRQRSRYLICWLVHVVRNNRKTIEPKGVSCGVGRGSHRPTGDIIRTGGLTATR